jgi:hypothetical protein
MINKKILLPLLFILFLGLLITGCEDKVADPVEESTAILRGQVTDQNNDPVADADVIASSTAFGTKTTTSNAEGNYQFTLNLAPEQPTTSYTISVSKSGFAQRSQTVPLAAGDDVRLNFVLGDEGDDNGNGNGDDPGDDEPSGPASNIVVVDVEATSIGVMSGGYDETTRLVFEARDADGRPVDSDHAIDVSFTIQGGPGGGEFLSPANGRTNDEGRVAVTLNAGVLAGVVQISAQATVDGRTITSTPVKLTIHGGLPAQEHFGLGVERINFPALQVVNARLGVVTVVGDKFSNPVRPGTGVYFRTKAGNIQTEAQTDDDGVAGVELISLGKNIIDPVHGPGFGYIVAETRGEDGVLVTDSALVMLSGRPIISVDPGTFSIPNNSSQTFNYTVEDYNGNPMAEGQSISVELELPELAGDAEAPELILSGNVDYTLPDTQSPAFTAFSFTLSVSGGAEENVVENMPVTIVISTSGPNGNLQLKFSGTVN